MLASPPACGGGVQSYSAKGQSALYKTLRSQSLDCQFPASIPFIPFPRKHLGAIVYNLIPSKVLKLHQEVVSLASSEKSELVPFLLYEVLISYRSDFAIPSSVLAEYHLRYSRSPNRRRSKGFADCSETRNTRRLD
ncbi:hypothetical protein PGTUg99_022539 [Puccinia graminis f. sp. tritici]|uniref:Uncharacterized protein n=1 Tax=Puccinia graminis f. sp. tritici TaxID=56615 RepID=A0A5B0R7Y6_PUCGR|nr:hypothetical protein PGTUg99_022539 [Puccinia graminis f. sp. tritici]